MSCLHQLKGALGLVLPSEQLYWITLNGTLHIYTLAKRLLTAGCVFCLLLSPFVWGRNGVGEGEGQAAADGGVRLLSPFVRGRGGGRAGGRGQGWCALRGLSTPFAQPARPPHMAHMLPWPTCCPTSAPHVPPRSYVAHMLPFLVFCVKALESHVIFSTSKYLTWRTQLYISLCYAYCDLHEHGMAKQARVCACVRVPVHLHEHGMAKQARVCVCAPAHACHGLRTRAPQPACVHMRACVCVCQGGAALSARAPRAQALPIGWAHHCRRSCNTIVRTICLRSQCSLALSPCDTQVVQEGLSKIDALIRLQRLDPVPALPEVQDAYRTAKTMLCALRLKLEVITAAAAGGGAGPAGAAATTPQVCAWWWWWW